MIEKLPSVYIITNKTLSTLYTGVTSNLIQRIYQHKNQLSDGFAKHYNCTILVYYETCGEILSAIAREKQIKSGSRKKKLN